jgi:hypothetical protein
MNVKKHNKTNGCSVRDEKDRILCRHSTILFSLLDLTLLNSFTIRMSCDNQINNQQFCLTSVQYFKCKAALTSVQCKQIK